MGLKGIFPYFYKQIRVGCATGTMCIVHKGFKGFRAVSPASILGGNLISLKPETPYDTIHSTL
jgi:hypothetical protein